MDQNQFFRLEPNWETIRPVICERLGRTYSKAYLSDVWRNQRSNRTLREKLIELIGEPESVRLIGGL
jgi:hypothetical protein